MIDRLKPKSEFSRNVLTLMTGTTIAQAIPIAITPILTRLYSPEDFGLLSIFVGVSMMAGSVANGRYELAIILPEKDDDAINIAALGLLIATVFSLLLFISVIFLNEEIISLLGNQEISFWLYFIPFVVWMTGLYNVLNYLNIRKKCYRDIAKATIYKSTAMAAVQLLYGFIRSGASGLISGQIAAQVLANYRLTINSKKNYTLKSINFERQMILAKRYIKFPKYSMWAGLANTSSTHLISVLISAVYSLGILGFYSLTLRALGMPAAMISSAVGQVFLEQATKEKNETGTAEKVFNQTLIKLFLISSPMFFILYWFVEDVFIIAFGPDWYIAGEYAQLLIPLFFVRFFVSPLTMMNVIFNKNEVGMYWQFALLFLQVFLIFGAEYLQLSFKEYLEVMVSIISIHYLVILMIMSRYNRMDTKNV